jgi:Cupredoxin-like domain
VYRWWVFVHVAGVFVFLAAHGVSMGVLFRLRTERDPQKVSDLLALSSTSISGLYVGMVILLIGGIVAGFLGHWWGQAWIWVAVGALLVVSFAMYGMARPYYQRVGFVARAMAGGSQAVTDEQFDDILKSSRPMGVAAIGVIGLLFILYLMMFKPTFGISTSSSSPAPTGAVAVAARGSQFDVSELRGPADRLFTLSFDNQDPGIPHNVAIYVDSSATTALFVGEVFDGSKVVDYQVPALPAGTYFFRCDVHHQMTGTFVAEATAAGSPSPTTGG